MTLQDLIVNLKLNAEQFVSGAQNAIGVWQSASGAMIAGGATLTAGVTVPIVGLGKAAYDMATQLQTAEIGFQTMLGSSEAAGKHLEELKQFAATTPFEFVDLVKASQRMQALGFAAEEVIPNLTAIGNAAAGLGGGADLINRLTLALGQMRAKGKVSGEEMRQLAEAGIPAWEILAKAAGMSIQETMEASRKGVFQVDQVLPVLIGGIQEKFGGLMENFSSTVMGRMSNLQDEIGFIMGDIGQTLMPMLNDLLETVVIPLVEKLRELAEWFAALSPPMQKAIVVVAALAAAVGPVVAALGGLGLALQGLMPLLTLLGGTGGLLASIGALLTPIGWAAAAVAAAWAAWELAKWTGAAEMWKDVLSAIWNQLSQAVEIVAAIALVIGEGFFGALKKVWDVLEPVRDAVIALAQWLGKLVLGPIIKMFEDWGKAMDKLWGWLSKLPGVSDAIDQVREAKSKLANATKSLTGEEKKAADEMERFVGPVQQANKEIPKLSGGLEKVKGKFYENWKEAEQFNTKLVAAHAALLDATKSTAAFNESWRNGEIAAEAESVREQIDAIEQSARSVIPVVSEMTQKMFDGFSGVYEVVEGFSSAFDTLGFKSETELQKTVDAAVEARDKILGNELSTDYEKKTAVYLALKAQVDIAKKVGREVPQSQQDMLDELERELKGNVDKKVVGPWQDAMKQVSTIVTDFGKNISNSVVDIFFGGSEDRQKLQDQEDELYDSLEARRQEWEDFQEDIANSFEEVEQAYRDTLTQGEQDLAESLSERESKYFDDVEAVLESIADQEAAYTEFADAVAEKISEINKGFQEELNRQTRDFEESLAKREKSFREYQMDNEQKLKEARADYEEGLEDENRDYQRDLEDRKTKYDRYVRDIQQKINEKLAAGKSASSSEIRDLQEKLADAEEDYNLYVQRRKEDYEEWIADNKAKLNEEVADLKLALQRKTEDHQEWIAGAERDYQEWVDDHKKKVDQQTADLQASLVEREVKLDAFKATAIEKIGALSEKWLAYREDAAAEFEQLKVDAAKKLDEQKAELHSKLLEQEKEWADFKDAANAELDQIGKDKAGLSIWGKIKSAVRDMLTGPDGLLASFVRVFSEAGIGKLISWAVGKLTGPGGLLEHLGAVGDLLNKVFGSAAGSVAGSAGSGAGGAAGSGAGGEAGVVGGAASGVVGALTMVGSLGSMVTGIISNFQNAKQETTLNAIEENTRKTSMYVGERGDGGIVMSNLKILEDTGYINASLDSIKDYWSDFKGQWSGGGVFAKLEFNTNWILKKLEDFHSTIADLGARLPSFDSDLSLIAANTTRVISSLASAESRLSYIADYTYWTMRHVEMLNWSAQAATTTPHTVNVVVNVSSTNATPEQIAAQLATSLRDQGLTS